MTAGDAGASSGGASDAGAAGAGGTSAEPTESEPNDSSGQANPLLPDATLVGIISPPTESDYFHLVTPLDPPGGGHFVLSLTDIGPSSVALDVRATVGNGQVVADEARSMGTSLFAYADRDRDAGERLDRRGAARFERDAERVR